MDIRIEEVPFHIAINYIREMTQEHWNEVPFGSFQLELDLNEGAYQFAEENGYMRTYVAFDNDIAVGYFTLAATDMIHHQGIYQAVTDTYFVTDCYRGKGVFHMLVQYIEQVLAEAGIRFLTINVNPTAGTAGQTEMYLDRNGYDLTERSYTKEL